MCWEQPKVVTRVVYITFGRKLLCVCIWEMLSSNHHDSYNILQTSVFQHNGASTVSIAHDKPFSSCATNSVFSFNVVWSPCSHFGISPPSSLMNEWMNTGYTTTCCITSTLLMSLSLNPHMCIWYVADDADISDLQSDVANICNVMVIMSDSILRGITDNARYYLATNHGTTLQCPVKNKNADKCYKQQMRWWKKTLMSACVCERAACTFLHFISHSLNKLFVSVNSCGTHTHTQH